MARLNIKGFHHEISFKTIGMNSFDEWIINYEGSTYLIRWKIHKIINNIYLESITKVVLDLHLQLRFLERIFL